MPPVIRKAPATVNVAPAPVAVPPAPTTMAAVTAPAKAEAVTREAAPKLPERAAAPRAKVARPAPPQRPRVDTSRPEAKPQISYEVPKEPVALAPLPPRRLKKGDIVLPTYDVEALSAQRNERDIDEDLKFDKFFEAARDASTARVAARRAGFDDYERYLQKATAQQVDLEDMLRAARSGQTFTDFVAGSPGVVGFLPKEQRRAKLDTIASQYTEAQQGRATPMTGGGVRAKETTTAIPGFGEGYEVGFTQPEEVTEVAKSGDSSFAIAEALIHKLSQDPRWAKRFDVYRNRMTGSATQQWINERKLDLIEQANLPLGDARAEEVAQAAQRQAFAEVVAAKTIGYWMPPIFVKPEDIEKGLSTGVLSAAAPGNIEIVGHLKSDPSKFVYRQESPAGYLIRALDIGSAVKVGPVPIPIPGQTIVTGLLTKQANESPSEAIARGIKTGANWAEYAMDETRGASAPVRGLAMGAGLVAAMTHPDALLGTANTWSSLSGAYQSRRARIINGRAEPILRGIEEAYNAKDFDKASKLEAEFRELAREYAAGTRENLASVLDRADGSFIQGIVLADPKVKSLNTDLGAKIIESIGDVPEVRGLINNLVRVGNPYQHFSVAAPEAAAKTGAKGVKGEVGATFETHLNAGNFARRGELVDTARDIYLANAPKTQAEAVAKQVDGTILGFSERATVSRQMGLNDIADYEEAMAGILTSFRDRLLKNDTGVYDDLKAALSKDPVLGRSAKDGGAAQKFRETQYESTLPRLQRNITKRLTTDIAQQHKEALELFDQAKASIEANIASRRMAAEYVRQAIAKQAGVQVTPREVQYGPLKQYAEQYGELSPPAYGFFAKLRQEFPDANIADQWAEVRGTDQLFLAQAAREGRDIFDIWAESGLGAKAKPAAKAPRGPKGAAPTPPPGAPPSPDEASQAAAVVQAATDKITDVTKVVVHPDAADVAASILAETKIDVPEDRVSTVLKAVNKLAEGAELKRPPSVSKNHFKLVADELVKRGTLETDGTVYTKTKVTAGPTEATAPTPAPAAAPEVTPTPATDLVDTWRSATAADVVTVGGLVRSFEAAPGVGSVKALPESSIVVVERGGRHYGFPSQKDFELVEADFDSTLAPVRFSQVRGVVRPAEYSADGKLIRRGLVDIDGVPRKAGEGPAPEPVRAPEAPKAEPVVEAPRVAVPGSAWLNHNAQISRTQADRAGLTLEIEDLFAQGLTLDQVKTRLGDRITFLPREERSSWLGDVRNSLGIPSRMTEEGQAEFLAWLSDYRRRRAGAAESATKETVAAAEPVVEAPKAEAPVAVEPTPAAPAPAPAAAAAASRSTVQQANAKFEQTAAQLEEAERALDRAMKDSLAAERKSGAVGEQTAALQRVLETRGARARALEAYNAARAELDAALEARRFAESERVDIPAPTVPAVPAELRATLVPGAEEEIVALSRRLEAGARLEQAARRKLATAAGESDEAFDAAMAEVDTIAAQNRALEEQIAAAQLRAGAAAPGAEATVIRRGAEAPVFERMAGEVVEAPAPTPAAAPVFERAVEAELPVARKAKGFSDKNSLDAGVYEVEVGGQTRRFFRDTKEGPFGAAWVEDVRGDAGMPITFLGNTKDDAIKALQRKYVAEAAPVARAAEEAAAAPEAVKAEEVAAPAQPTGITPAAEAPVVREEIVTPPVAPPVKAEPTVDELQATVDRLAPLRDAKIKRANVSKTGFTVELAGQQVRVEKRGDNWVNAATGRNLGDNVTEATESVRAELVLKPYTAAKDALERLGKAQAQAATLSSLADALAGVEKIRTSKDAEKFFEVVDQLPLDEAERLDVLAKFKAKLTDLVSKAKTEAAADKLDALTTRIDDAVEELRPAAAEAPSAAAAAQDALTAQQRHAQAVSRMRALTHRAEVTDPKGIDYVLYGTVENDRFVPVTFVSAREAATPSAARAALYDQLTVSDAAFAATRREAEAMLEGQTPVMRVFSGERSADLADSEFGSVADRFPSLATVERDVRRAAVIQVQKQRQAELMIARLGGEAVPAWEDVPTRFVVMAERRLARAEEGLKAKKITQDQFNELVAGVRKDLETKAEIERARKLRPRARGADWVRSRLLAARSNGVLDAEGVQLADWFLQKNPQLAEDLGVSLKKPKATVGGPREVGAYQKTSRIVTLFKSESDELTAVHEILHHTERMLPPELQTAIRKEWSRQLLEAMKKATPEQRGYLEKLLLGANKDELKEMFTSGVFPISQFYQFVNPSEFWAVNASKIVSGRYAALNAGLVARAKQWLSEFIQKAKSVFGLSSNAPIIRGLDDVMRGDGTFVTNRMLSEGSDFFPAVAGDTKALRRRVTELQESKKRLETALTEVARDLKEARQRGSARIVAHVESRQKAFQAELTRVEAELKTAEDQVAAAKKPEATPVAPAPVKAPEAAEPAPAPAPAPAPEPTPAPTTPGAAPGSRIDVQAEARRLRQQMGLDEPEPIPQVAADVGNEALAEAAARAIPEDATPIAATSQIRNLIIQSGEPGLVLRAAVRYLTDEGLTAADIDVLAEYARSLGIEVRAEFGRFVGTEDAVAKAHELVGDAYMVYIATREAPSEGLRAVFEYFSDALSRLYRSVLAGPDGDKIPDSVRGVFDRLAPKVGTSTEPPSLFQSVSKRLNTTLAEGSGRGGVFTVLAREAARRGVGNATPERLKKDVMSAVTELGEATKAARPAPKTFGERVDRVFNGKIEVSADAPVLEFPVPIFGRETWSVNDLSAFQETIDAEARALARNSEVQFDLLGKPLEKVISEKIFAWTGAQRPRDEKTFGMAAAKVLAVEAHAFLGGSVVNERGLRMLSPELRADITTLMRTTEQGVGDAAALMNEATLRGDMTDFTRYLSGQNVVFRGYGERAAGRRVLSSGFEFSTGFLGLFQNAFDAMSKAEKDIIQRMADALNSKTAKFNPDDLSRLDELREAERVAQEAGTSLAAPLASEYRALLNRYASFLVTRDVTPSEAIVRMMFPDDATLSPNRVQKIRQERQNLLDQALRKVMDIQTDTKESLAQSLGIAIGAITGRGGQPSFNEFRMVEAILYAAGRTGRDGAFVDAVDVFAKTEGLLKDTARIMGGAGRGAQGGEEAARRLGVLMAGYGAAVRGKIELVNLGATMSTAEFEAFKRFSLGYQVDPMMQGQLQRVAQRFGFNADFLQETMLGTDLYIPAAARKMFLDAVAKASYEKLTTVNLGAELFASALVATKKRMTRGNLVLRPRYFNVNTVDHFFQMNLIFGARIAAASTTRLTFQTLLTSRVGYVFSLLLDRAPNAVLRFATDGRVSLPIAERVRDALSKAGDLVAAPLNKMLSDGKYRIEVNKILDGVDEMIILGDRAYNTRRLREVAVGEGVFSSYDTRRMGEAIRRQGEFVVNEVGQLYKNTSDSAVLVAWDGAREWLTGGFRNTVDDLADAWAERERVGGYVTLIEAGMDPRVAARLMIDALYDYGQSMTDADRRFFVQILLPFWAFQKNANGQFVNSLFTPRGAFRMQMWLKFRYRAADMITRLLYEGDGGELGFDVDAMDERTQQLYYAILTKAHDQYGPVLPEEVRVGLRMLLTGQPVSASQGETYELAANLREPYAEQLTLETNQLFRRYMLSEPTKSALPTFMRDRPAIGITRRRTAYAQLYAALTGVDDHVTWFVVPESSAESSLKFAAHQMGAHFAVLESLVQVVKKEVSPGRAVSNVVRPIIDLERAPIVGAMAPMFTGRGYPQRIHPAVAAVMEASGVPLIRVPAARDPFEDGQLVEDIEIKFAEAQAEGREFDAKALLDEQFLRDVRELNETGKQVSEIATQTRFYLPPGPFSNIFENASGVAEPVPIVGAIGPLYEINRALLDIETRPNEAIDAKGRIEYNLRVLLGADILEVSGERTAAKEEPRFTTDTKKPQLR